MIEISRDEFVKRYEERLGLIVEGEAYDDFKYLEMVLLDAGKWEEVKGILLRLHSKHFFLENTPCAEDVVKLIEELERVVCQ